MSPLLFLFSHTSLYLLLLPFFPSQFMKNECIEIALFQHAERRPLKAFGSWAAPAVCCCLKGVECRFLQERRCPLRWDRGRSGSSEPTKEAPLSGLGSAASGPSGRLRLPLLLAFFKPVSGRGSATGQRLAAPLGRETA